MASSVVTVLSGSIPAAKAAIIGVDNRITPSYDWLVGTGRQPIGRLEILAADKNFYICSFTVVGRNIGLTNSHCLRDAQGRGPLQVKAFALQYGSGAFASANVDLYWTGLPRFPITIGDGTRDWAIVRFTTNLGNTTGWFGNEAYFSNVNNAGGTVVGAFTNLIGYSGGGTTPTGHLGCRIGQVASGILLHDCDTLPGSSGSSLHTATRRVQGLHWGSLTYNGSTINGSVPLERFMPAVAILRANGAAPVSVPVP
ncbi:MAG: trypsin-like serine peptidase [Pseudanabaena sp.]